MRYLFLLLSLFLSLASYGQGFKVKNLKQQDSDEASSIIMRKDAYGDPCGLLKVATKVTGVEFVGRVVGKTSRPLDEYWVYLTAGTEELTIIRPNYLPMTVRFADYGINRIESGVVYTLSLKDVDLHPEKCRVTLQVRPTNADVTVDSILLQPNKDGYYQLLLPKGEHHVQLSSYTFRPVEKTIETGKEPQNMEVEMESVLATVTITGPTRGEICINGEQKGILPWTGKLMPGEYIVDLRREGYLPTQKSITLNEQEESTVTMPEMEQIKGVLNVTTQPSGCTVMLDGHPYGRTPVVIPDVIYGDHTLAFDVDSVALRRHKELSVEVTEVGTQDIQCTLATDAEFDLHRRALGWFKNGVHADVKGESSQGYFPPRAARVWYDSIMAVIDSLDASFFQEQMFFKEFEGNPTLSAQQRVSDRLFLYYTYINASEDEPIRMKNGSKYSFIHEPEKALLVAQKAGKELSRHEMSFIAMSYAALQNESEAVQWFTKWWDKESAENEPTDYASGRCCFAAAQIYKRMEKEDEARTWFSRALNILEKTEKSPAKLKKYKAAAQ